MSKNFKIFWFIVSMFIVGLVIGGTDEKLSFGDVLALAILSSFGWPLILGLIIGDIIKSSGILM